MIGMMMVLAAAVVAPAVNWENTEVNSENRLPARTYSMPLKDEASALTDELEPETPWKRSLNGMWKFSWAGNPELREKDFYREDYDDSKWFEIDVPSCVEMRGFGSPGYTNWRYPHANKWPKILDRQSNKPDYNPVSSYRRTFEIPAEWAGRRIILRFDGVYSAYWVWVNGKKAGYAEDSKLPSEFDITELVKAGENRIAVEVYRWCDGSYLEDQDMVRFSGIFRDVTIWAQPKDGIWDFYVVAASDGSIKVSGIEGEWSAKLYDAAGAKVCELSAAEPFKILEMPNFWSAEKPYLYTLVIRKGEDVRMKRVGFKSQNVVGNAILVNGKKIKFKGVNRHETSVENGRTVTVKEMIEDIELMKKYNINTVRTCHYPDHHLWYDLCDKYGIYLCAEANVEGHEPGYGKNGLGKFSEWNHTIVERNERHAVFYRNNASVTMWSMGNETCHGDCFRNAIKAVKAIDPTRPVHWERGNEDADIDSAMYPTVEWAEKRGRLGDGEDVEGVDLEDGRHKHTKGKAFFMCEYAHAMGNAVGNLQEYWDVFYRYDSLSGGCIWDWVDQAIWKDTEKIDPKTGKMKRILAYGGDFDESPNDGPFDCNGVVDPFRRVSAKLIEVGHVYRNLVVTKSVMPQDNPYAVVFELWNRYCFTRADEFEGRWRLLENGVETAGGAFEPPALEPLRKCRFVVSGLAEALASSKAGAELFVNFEFVTRKDTAWAAKGWIVARDQVVLGRAEGKERRAECGGFEGLRETEKTVEVECGGTKAVFCRKSGTLCELEMGGRTVLKDPSMGIVAGPRVTFARAFTDNDKWMRQSFFDSGLTQIRYHARKIEVVSNEVKIVTEITGSKSAGFTHEATWRFGNDGAVEVANVVVPHGTLPRALPRLGLSLKLDKELNRVKWYGRGPYENYIDRCTGSFFGVWSSTVEELGEFYVRPQDNGYRGDVRWVKFTDAKGRGVRMEASEPMYVQALKCGWEDLEFARHRNGSERNNTPVAEDNWINVNLDVRQMGLGGNSCGPQPMEKYRFGAEQRVEWKVRIEAEKE